MDGSLRTPPPNVDPLGMHTLTTQGFESFLADANAETAPGSLYLYHQLLPHTPMVFRADGSIRSEIAADGGTDTNWQHYGEQASYFDSLVGRFVARLKAEGIYDEAVIIITGDHGRRPYHIQERDFTEEAPEVPVIMPHVPLLVHSSAVDTGVYDVDYQHKDFEATFMAALGREAPAGEGVSAFAVERPERDKVFYIDQENEHYWSYVYNEKTQVWDFVEFVDDKLFPHGLAVSPRH
jgi:arylsulfatase A-like enzyme